MPDITVPDLTLTLNPLVGTTNVYGGYPVMANVASNVVQDGQPSLTVTPDGTVLLAWIEDSDETQVWIGSRVFVASMQNGGWTTPVEVTSSRGFNSDVKITTDSLGNPLLVWTMASSADESLTNTVDQVTAVMAANNVVFSTFDGANWSAPANVAVLPGTEDNVTLGTTANGQTLATWLNDIVDTNNMDTMAIYAAIWNGIDWTTPSLVATAQVSGQIAVSVVGGRILTLLL